MIPAKLLPIRSQRMLSNERFFPHHMNIIIRGSTHIRLAALDFYNENIMWQRNVYLKL